MALLLRKLPVKGVPLPYLEFILCREMGWTFTELEEQPAERIAQAFAFLSEEVSARDKEG